MHRPVHPSLGRVKPVFDWYKYGWTGKKMKEQKNLYIDTVRYTLEMSVKGVTCVFVVHFRSKKHLKFVNWLNTNS